MDNEGSKDRALASCFLVIIALESFDVTKIFHMRSHHDLALTLTRQRTIISENFTFRCFEIKPIGNPVRIRDGPAAVIPPFKKEPFQQPVPLTFKRVGKAAERAGKSEDLPGCLVWKLSLKRTFL